MKLVFGEVLWEIFVARFEKDSEIGADDNFFALGSGGFDDGSEAVVHFGRAACEIDRFDLVEAVNDFDELLADSVSEFFGSVWACFYMAVSAGKIAAAAQVNL